MCELLGVCSSIQTNIKYSAQSMKAHSEYHNNGWGVVFYPDNSIHCWMFKEDKPMYKSMLLPILNGNNIIQLKIILNHIRKSTNTEAYENTHPFYRELFGEHWSLIHNGSTGMDKYFKKYLE